MARQNTRALWAEKLKSAPATPAKKKAVKAGGSAGFAGVKTAAQFSGVILGIDPSLRGTGLAVIEVRAGCKPKYLRSLTVKNKDAVSFADCIKNIFIEVSKIVRQFDIDCVAIEQSIYVQNNRVAVTLGAARGAAIAAVSMLDKEIFEYAPLRIKQAVVGFGRASKEQVSRTMSALVEGAPERFPYDEADAAAAALAHAYTRGRGSTYI